MAVGMCSEPTSATPKNDVPADRIGAGGDGIGRGCSSNVSVNADPAEIIAKPRLKKRARRCVERLPRLPKHLMENRRRFDARGLRHRGGLHLQPFLVFFLALGAFAAELRGTGRYRKRGVGHSHNVISDPVGLALKRIVD
jgi:hypothetical protein